MKLSLPTGGFHSLLHVLRSSSDRPSDDTSWRTYNKNTRWWKISWLVFPIVHIPPGKCQDRICLHNNGYLILDKFPNVMRNANKSLFKVVLLLLHCCDLITFSGYNHWNAVSAENGITKWSTNLYHDTNWARKWRMSTCRQLLFQESFNNSSSYK